MQDQARRRLNSKIGGLTTAARHDPRVYTAAARSTFLDSFLDQVPSDLPPAERERRAAALRRLHFARLAAKSAAVRRSKRNPAPSDVRAGFLHEEVTPDDPSRAE